MKNLKHMMLVAGFVCLTVGQAFATCSDAQWAAADAACGSISSNYSAYSCNAGGGGTGTAQIGCAPDNCLTVAGGGSSKPNYACAQTYSFTIFLPKTVAPIKK